MSSQQQAVSSAKIRLSNMLASIGYWLNAKGYAQGVFWITLVSLTSSSNDILMRFLGARLAPMQIAFSRFAFAAIILFPIMLHYGNKTFATARPGLHIIRALLGFLAVTLWCQGVAMAPLANVSTIALTVPLFVLPLAYLILHEKVGLYRVVATIVGFLGILVISKPTVSKSSYLLDFNTGILMLVISALLFALSDILNKFMVKHEGTLAMLFYFALGTSIVGLLPALYVWQQPTINEMLLLFMLGFGGNFILYCLLKAFAAVDISALVPYRYLELVFALAMGYLLFGEIPGINTMIGSSIIILATLLVAYYDTKKN